MGAGKTTVAQAYAKTYDLPLIDTDVEIEKKAGMPIAEIFKKQGEEAFRCLETQVLRELIEKRGAAVISVGGGLPMRRLLAERSPVYREMSHVSVDVNGRAVSQVVEEIHARMSGT